MKSGAVCKTPFGKFTKTMFSSRGKWEREACGRDKEDPYSREWVLGINNGSPEGLGSWVRPNNLPGALPSNLCQCSLFLHLSC